MEGENAERWKELCALAAKEQGPGKLRLLAQEINRLLKQKAERLDASRKALTGLATKDHSEPNSGF
jgi:hypothetical protein